MLRKIKLYGKLAKFIGKRVLEADVATAAEAVRFLAANWPEVEQHMADQYYRVTVGSYDLDLDEIHHPVGQETIKIVPVVAGAGATARIILGVVLFAVATLATAGGGAIFGAAIAKNIGFLAFAQGLGASLALGGVAQLISPVPKVATGPDTDQDPRKSYSFSGIINVTRQGTPVPIVYGETIVGSVVISAGIDTVQVVG
jgi:predicted phage tail protein